MKKKLLRNILWIALLVVWSFIAGAYFYLRWTRFYKFSYTSGFIMGGIGIWLVFFAIGFWLYRFLKKHRSSDPTKTALAVVTFFTLCFLVIAGVKYDKVQSDKFVEDMEEDFVLHYEVKAKKKGLKIDDLHQELEGRYYSIQSTLRRHPEVDKLMQLQTSDALFEENHIISDLIVSEMELEKKIGYPPSAGIMELFVNDTLQ